MIRNILVSRTLGWGPNGRKMMNWGKLLRASYETMFVSAHFQHHTVLHSQIVHGLKIFLQF